MLESGPRNLQKDPKCMHESLHGRKKFNFMDDNDTISALIKKQG